MTYVHYKDKDTFVLPQATPTLLLQLPVTSLVMNRRDEKKTMHETWENVERFIVPYIRPENVEGHERDMVDLRARCEGFPCTWRRDLTHDKHCDLFVRNGTVEINLGLSIFVQLYMLSDFPDYQPLFPLSQFMLARMPRPQEDPRRKNETDDDDDDWRDQGLNKYLFKMVASTCEVPREKLDLMQRWNRNIREAGAMDYWLVFFKRCRTSPYHAPSPTMRPQAKYPGKAGLQALWTREQTFLDAHKEYIRSRVRFMMMQGKNRESLAPTMYEEEKTEETEDHSKKLFDALLTAFNGNVAAAAKAVVKLT